MGILDRIISNMATRREIPWSGIIAEAVAIIAGILVAFAIDAWWDERNTQDWAAAQLLAIRDEFAQNLTALDEIVRTHDSNADKLEIIVNKIRKVEYGDRISASAAVWSALIAWRTADISTGTLEALLASGRLGDIDSPGDSAITGYLANSGRECARRRKSGARLCGVCSCAWVARTGNTLCSVSYAADSGQAGRGA